MTMPFVRSQAPARGKSSAMARLFAQTAWVAGCMLTTSVAQVIHNLPHA